MTRRFFLVPLLAVAIVGSVKGQGASEKKKDAVEVEKKEVLDFDRMREQADETRDREAIPSFYADDFTFVSEKFGRGEVFNKAQYLELRTSAKKPFLIVSKEHVNINLHVFGNTVVMTGLSKNVLRYKGKLSTSPRLFTFVFVKQDGRWQTVAMHISDIPNGSAPWNY